MQVASTGGIEYVVVHSELFAPMIGRMQVK